MTHGWFKNRQNLPPCLGGALPCLLAAFRFLTIVPISWRSERDGKYFQHSLPYFPVLGAIIGCVVGGVSFLLHTITTAAVGSVLTIIMLAMISGCLHLDGLADTADGFFSSRPKERMLEIMRDSRIGAMGVIAIVFVLLLKYAALSTLSPASMFRTVVLMPLSGRAAIVLSMVLLPYARETEGLGKLFYSQSRGVSAMWSIILLILTAAFWGRRTMFFCCAATAITVLSFAVWCKRKIGGTTGDTLGAVCELTETAVAIAIGFV